MEISIVFGTETGNREALAENAKKYFQRKQVLANVYDIAEVTLDKLNNILNK